MRKLLTTAFVFASMTTSVSAFAQTENSEFFWQAGEGNTYLIPSLSLISGEMKTGSMTVDTDVTILSLSAEHGLSPNVSAHGNIGYSSGKMKSGATSVDSKGLDDVGLGIKVTRALNTGNVKYGANLNLSLEKEEVEANGDSNAASGQHYIEPYLGYELSMEQMKFGGKVSYEVNIGDKKRTDTGAEENSSGGETLVAQLFAENNYGSHTFGVNLSYLVQKDRKYNNGSVSEGDNDWGGLVYGNFRLNDTTELGARLGYINLDSKNVTGAAFLANASLRFAL